MFRLAQIPHCLSRRSQRSQRSRRFIALVFGLLLPLTAAAQSYPSKSIRFVVPYPAGGPLDTVARLLGQKVSEAVKQPVIVDNKPGAGGNIGADAVAKSPPDGYTILMGAVATHAINPTLYGNITYDPVKDFAPVTQVASTPNVLRFASRRLSWANASYWSRVPPAFLAQSSVSVCSDPLWCPVRTAALPRAAANFSPASWIASSQLMSLHAPPSRTFGFAIRSGS